ncbi:MAG: MBL fold metallo-hydrolase [Fibrobacter sp.]|jgi:L-ascorbate metabolism protein UlaG (beta-lactamase superfamily)|nr:MBL fold metallo-hydrolase [Fibrobacter sp.]
MKSLRTLFFLSGISFVAFLFSCCSHKPTRHLIDEQAAVSEDEMKVLKSGKKYYYPIKMKPKLLPEIKEKSYWERLKELNTNTARTHPLNFLPADPVQVEKAFPPNDSTGFFITWLGHSSLLIQMDGFKILFDPVLANEVSPAPFFRSVRRFQENAPVTAAEIPPVDLIFISHDHYDHLDKKAILELAPKTNRFVTSVGVGERLIDWGVPAEKVQILSWWEESVFENSAGKKLNYAGTPGRHFSGRSLLDRNTTLWISWVVWTKEHKIFHSGDTSYGPHFKQIGFHYGPFDYSFMECGQYNRRWSNNHQFPEETVQAHLDIRGEILFPIHWGAFSLAPHTWWDPPARVKIAAEKAGVKLITPRVGQTINADNPEPTDSWWEPLVEAENLSAQ